MTWLIPLGAVFTLVGLAGLVWCIATAMKARKSGLAEDQLRHKLQSLVAWNMAALGTSAAGLMLVVIGILLG